MNQLNLDGTRIFVSDADKKNEQAISDICAERWDCEIRPFGPLAPVDWFAVRFGRIVGIAELKSRPYASDQYPCAWLSVRKWLALQLGSIGLGVPALFVVSYTDQILWIKTTSVDATQHKLGGRAKPRTQFDIEPIIEIPIMQMERLA